MVHIEDALVLLPHVVSNPDLSWIHIPQVDPLAIFDDRSAFRYGSKSDFVGKRYFLLYDDFLIF